MILKNSYLKSNFDWGRRDEIDVFLKVFFVFIKISTLNISRKTTEEKVGCHFLLIHVIK